LIKVAQNYYLQYNYLDLKRENHIMYMADIYDVLTCKLETMKDYINKIKIYNNDNNSLQYIEKLNTLSTNINYNLAILEDMYNLYIENIDMNELSAEDRHLQKENKISKQINDTFLPLMLYMQIMLQNK